jgi:hypothetical protein
MFTWISRNSAIQLKFNIEQKYHINPNVPSYMFHYNTFVFLPNYNMVKYPNNFVQWFGIYKCRKIYESFEVEVKLKR